MGFYRCCWVILFLSVSAVAQETGQEMSQNWFMLQFEFGDIQKRQVTAPEIDNGGSLLGLAGAYSRYQKNWIYDLGLGLRFDSMRNQGVRIETKAFSGQLGARYRFNRHWSLGPQLGALMGQDVSFSDTGSNSDDKPLSVFAGVRLQYDWYRINAAEREQLFRFGLQYMQDLDIDQRRIQSVSAVMEYALPIRKAKRMFGVAKPVAAKIDLRAANINFVTGSAELEPKSKTKLLGLAGFLAKYPKDWDYLDIDGHTDKRGDYATNIKLSLDRAEAVRTALVEGGLQAQQMEVTGFGPDRPLRDEESESAYLLNRRVEIQLRSESASEDFLRELNQLMASGS